MAYLRLIVNPNDAASLRRVINYPTRGIGAKTQERLERYAQDEGLSLWQAVERVEAIDTLSTRATNAVARFRALIAEHAAAAADDAPADELARDLVQEAGLLKELRKEHTRENLVRWENVQELISAVAEYTATSENATLSTFLQEVSLLTDADNEYEDANRVTLMTLHASKGLEYPVVFITGLEEGLFPMARAAQDKADLEEERRLFYVGATRAEEHLVLTYARSRYRYGDRQPATRSRFLDEVNPDVVRTEAGGELRQSKGRFTAKAGPTKSYDDVDPNYWRQSLRREASGRTAKKKGRRTVKSTKQAGAGRSSGGSNSDGRRVVYDEGEGGQLAPGMRVEHSHFGEGKVLSMEGQGAKATAVVFFGPDIGQKKLKLKFARLRRIG
jgi:DNA helicase-2/ATP-dependent DNA helicase PcrA